MGEGFSREVGLAKIWAFLKAPRGKKSFKRAKEQRGLPRILGKPPPKEGKGRLLNGGATPFWGGRGQKEKNPAGLPPFLGAPPPREKKFSGVFFSAGNFYSKRGGRNSFGGADCLRYVASWGKLPPTGSWSSLHSRRGSKYSLPLLVLKEYGGGNPPN